MEKITSPGTPPGVVLGHEVVGMLERPGLEPERVALAHHVPCGTCDLCRSGHSSLCPQFKSTHLEPGGFAEELAVTGEHLESVVMPLPDEVDDLTGTLVEPLSCTLRALDVASRLLEGFPLPYAPGGDAGGGGGRETAKAGGARPPRESLRVGVWGCGSVGLLFLSALSRWGPGQEGMGRGTEIFYSEPNPARARLARDLGARPAQTGLHLAFVTTPAGTEEALTALGPGGVAVVFAAEEDGRGAGFDPDLIYRNELTVVGVRSGSPAHVRRAADLLGEGALPLGWLASEVVSLEEMPAAAERYRRGETLKVVVRP